MSVVALEATRLGEVLDLAERLPADEQEMLVEIMRSRLRERRREESLAQVAEAEEEYRQGNYVTGSVDEFMAELDR